MVELWTCETGKLIHQGVAKLLDSKTILVKFQKWEVAISPNLTDSEYSAVDAIERIKENRITRFNADLHLAVSMRSYRAENVSLFIKQLLDLDKAAAQETYKQVNKNYANLIATAKAAYNKKDYTTARVMYASAEALKPEQTEPTIKLAEIDSEQAEIEAKEAIQNQSDSLKTSGEIALASNEFPLAFV